LGRAAAQSEAAKTIFDRIRKGEKLEEIEKAYNL
jgi:hypothetical protein